MRRSAWQGGVSRASRALWACLSIAGGWTGGSASAGKATPAMPQPEQHRPFFLRTEAGEVINPLTGQNAALPYSPAQTCGASRCHDYTVITRGYHFVHGGDGLREGFDPKRPWALSAGMFGGHIPGALRQLARKKSGAPEEIDATVWEWATAAAGDEPPCSACHAGGGGLELDRDGKRLDRTLAERPELARSLDGDYRGAAWAKSGVVEADCLLCHSSSYEWKERARHLKQGNLKWAATAAAGLGVVRGRILDPATGKLTGETPSVVYNRRLFNEDGKVVAPIVKRPGDRSCLNCHGQPGLQKRGFTWNDPVNPDVHNQQGISCVQCHASGLDHNFGRGRPIVQRVRPELTGTMRGCHDCHGEGAHGATIPAHAALPPSHLRKIDCRTCHIPALHRTALRVLDASRGDAQWDVIGGSGQVGRNERWSPAYLMSQGKIRPVSRVWALWWGNREANGTVVPLFARELREAWAIHGGQVTDDNGDGVPEVNRPEEIAAGLRAVAKVLAGTKRFRRVDPVYAKGGKLYSLDERGQVIAREDPAAGPVHFSVSHNVAPSKQALGAGGCADCHAREGKFLSSAVVVDPFDGGGKEIREPVYRSFGMSDVSYTLFSIYWTLARPWLGLVLLLVFFLSTMHFTRFGPHDFGGKSPEPRPDDNERMKRFSWFERMLHLGAIGSFFFLAFTGLAFSFDGWRWMQLFFGDNLTPRVWHGWVGYVFGAGVLLMLVRWWRDAIPVKADLEWVKKFGGYLGSHDPVPAGRFNAGQKVYFWTVIAGGIALLASGVILYFPEHLPLDAVFVAAIVHNLAGLFGVAGVLSHMYLSTAANPGTAQAIFAGWVTKGWARLHHPLWFEKVTGRKAFGNEEKEKEEKKRKEG